MADLTRTKWCAGCMAAKPCSEFRARKGVADGLQPRCKSCQGEYQRRYYQANREKRKRQAAEWYAANAERRREQNRAWYAANKARSYANSRAWIEANREAYTEVMRRRRARIAAVTVGDVDLDALWTGACGICQMPMDRELKHPDPMSKSVDHIVPISRGGTHEQSNLQWAHLVCNISKGASMPAA